MLLAIWNSFFKIGAATENNRLRVRFNLLESVQVPRFRAARTVREATISLKFNLRPISPLLAELAGT